MSDPRRTLVIEPAERRTSYKYVYQFRVTKINRNSVEIEAADGNKLTMQVGEELKVRWEDEGEWE